MNIISKSSIDRDPFEQSDRDFNGGAGKGDRDRSNVSNFKRNFPTTMGRQRCKPGRTTFNYGR